MFIDKLIATAPGLVGIVVIGFIGHVPLLCIAAVDGVVIAVAGVMHKVNEWDKEYTEEINQRKRASAESEPHAEPSGIPPNGGSSDPSGNLMTKARKRDSNQNVSTLEVRVEALESRDKKRDSEIQAMKQEIEQLKKNGKLAEQSSFADKRRSVQGLFPPSSESSNDPDITAGVDGKSQMSGIKQ